MLIDELYASAQVSQQGISRTTRTPDDVAHGSQTQWTWR